MDMLTWEESAEEFISPSTSLINHIANGGTVTSTNNLVLSGPLQVNGNTVLNLNGRTIRYEGTVFQVNEGAVLTINGDGIINEDILSTSLDRLKVDKTGLDETDRLLLTAIIERFNGGPVGLEALASSIGEEATTIEDVYEPYLLQQGYLKRTARGRVVTDKTYEYLGIKKD